MRYLCGLNIRADRHLYGDEGFLASGSLDAEKYYEQDCTKEAREDDE